MPEIFKPRANMFKIHGNYYCRDSKGLLICEGGPSVIHDDGRLWQFWTPQIGYHRLNGPATSDGDWFINGKDVTKEIYIFAKENDIDLENLQDEDKVLIALRFG